MTLSFIFGKGQQYETPEELARARASADGLLADQPTPTDLGSGLNAIGRALLYRAMVGDIQASERAGRDSAAAAFNPIAGAMSGPGAFPPPIGIPVMRRVILNSRSYVHSPRRSTLSASLRI